MISNIKKALMCLATAALLTACSTTGQGDVADPAEKLNRGIFKFNDVVDTAVLKPVAKGYRAGVPQPVPSPGRARGRWPERKLQGVDRLSVSWLGLQS